MENISPTKLSLYAMATRFELALFGESPARLRAAGEEALREIKSLDEQLSFYNPSSELSKINALAEFKPVKVQPVLFNLLKLCERLYKQTEGAFDITVAPLMETWRFTNGNGEMPAQSEIQNALSLAGMRHVILDDRDFTVSFDHHGVKIDLGAIGKGFAIERAANLLRESGVKCGLIHGGTSMIQALGAPPDSESWRIAIKHPKKDDEILDCAELNDNALAISAVHGKSFVQNGKEYGHIIDPRSGWPTQSALTSAVSGPSAAICDALSTALLVLGEEGISTLADQFPNYAALAAIPSSNAIKVAKYNWRLEIE